MLVLGLLFDDADDDSSEGLFLFERRENWFFSGGGMFGRDVEKRSSGACLVRLCVVTGRRE